MKGVIFTENIDMIMNGTKTQTRRVIKPKYSNTRIDWFTNKYGTRLCEIQNEDETTHVRNSDGTTTHQLLAYMELSPRYCPGEIIYVKEVWGKVGYSNTPQYIAYFADGRTLEEIQREDIGFEWNKPMFMPESAARLFLRVTAVRAERLQDISVEDVWREGVDVGDVPPEPDPHSTIPNWDVLSEARQNEYIEMWARSHYFKCLDKAREANRAFINLWDGLNAKCGYGWEKNPWVWVYTFERTTVDLLPADQQGLQGAAQPVLMPAT